MKFLKNIKMILLLMCISMPQKSYSMTLAEAFCCCCASITCCGAACFYCTCHCFRRLGQLLDEERLHEERREAARRMEREDREEQAAYLLREREHLWLDLDPPSPGGRVRGGRPVRREEDEIASDPINY